MNHHRPRRPRKRRTPSPTTSWSIQVAAALRKQKHRVSILGVHSDVRKLVSGFSRRKPDLVFNLMEMFGDNIRGDVAVAGLLDLLGLRYTGGGPGELYLRQDKGLAKKVLAFEQHPLSRLRRLLARTPTSRPAATCACRCSSSRSRPTPRSASTASRWSATPPR